MKRNPQILKHFLDQTLVDVETDDGVILLHFDNGKVLRIEAGHSKTQFISIIEKTVTYTTLEDNI